MKLTNDHYKSIVSSYLKIASDALNMVDKKNNIFIEKLINNEVEEEGWLQESSYLNNINWLLLNSIYIAIYSAFEHFLLKTIKTIENNPNTKIKFEQIGGKSMIDRFKNYILIAGGLSIGDKSKAIWGNFSQFQRVRNILIHNGGIMQESNEKDIKQHKCYKFMLENDVTILGTLGLIRIQNLVFINLFIEITSQISDIIVKEFKEKNS